MLGDSGGEFFNNIMFGLTTMLGTERTCMPFHAAEYGMIEQFLAHTVAWCPQW